MLLLCVCCFDVVVFWRCCVMMLLCVDVVVGCRCSLLFVRFILYAVVGFVFCLFAVVVDC